MMSEREISLAKRREDYQKDEGVHAFLKLQGREPKRANPLEMATHHCSTCGFTIETCGKKYPSFAGRPCSIWVRKITISKSTEEKK